MDEGKYHLTVFVEKQVQILRLLAQPPVASLSICGVMKIMLPKTCRHPAPSNGGITRAIV
jgi:hypothetical protein